MKTLIGALFGAGALGLVFVAYLALTGREEVRQEIIVDKARFEQEATKYDQAFEQKWRDLESKDSKKGQRNDRGMRINDAKSLDQVSKQLTSTQAASDEDLAEMKATLEAIIKKR